MKNLILLSTIVVLPLTGCLGTFQYEVSKVTPQIKHQRNCIVAVKNFKDKRPTIGGSGKMWLSYLPLMPFGWGAYNIPERGKIYLSISCFQFNPQTQLAQAAEMSLKSSGLFKKIYYEDEYEYLNINPDYIFTGNIKSTLYSQKVFTYCLSCFGSLFWFLGAPAGWTDNELEIEFLLLTAKEKKVIWTHKEKVSESRLHWFYYQGQDVKDYVPVMQKCMNKAISNMNENLSF